VKIWRTTCLAWLIGLLPLAVSAAGPADGWRADYARLLSKYVTVDGVRYGAWKKDLGDMAAMDRVVKGIGEDRSTDLAFYINAYNAWVLHEALALYPVKTVKFMFVQPRRLEVGGAWMSFDALERQVMWKRYPDPRIHFALYAANWGGAPLSRELYEAGRLEEQLEQATRAFVNSDRAIRQGKYGLEASRIFTWYKDDFHDGVESFLRQYRTTPLPPKFRPLLRAYDWSLNEVP
jgi:hypothetical protein